MSRNPWGSPVAAAAARAGGGVNLYDVMDEELAAKLQREEEEQFELEIAGRFGDDHQVGWCFVEVPSAADCEYGVMSVVQQEIPRDERPSGSDDPDYTFALELQAQEAEEYDRLRRQEEASMERIRVIQQEHPQREEIRKALLQKFYHSDSRLSVSAADEQESADDDDGFTDSGASSGAAAAVSGAVADEDQDLSETGDKEDSQGQNLHVLQHMAQQPLAAGHVDRVHLRDLDIHRGIYMDGDDLGLPRKKISSLSQALKHADRKQRSYHHSYHRRPKTHGDQTTETT
ncbi:hypothetical protein Gpo141_00004170 [Globisporangium polare]